MNQNIQSHQEGLLFKVVIISFLLSLLYYLGLALNGVNYFGYSEENIKILSYIFQFTNQVVIWWAIGVYCKDKKSAFSALLFYTILWIIHLYYFKDNSYATPVSKVQTLFSFAITFSSYLVFAIMHFKSKKGAQILLIPIITTGILFGYNSYFPNGLLDLLLNFFNIDDWFRIDVAIAENRSIRITLKLLINNAIISVFHYIAFKFVYDNIKSSHAFFPFMKTIKMSPQISNLGFSLIFWTTWYVLYLSMTKFWKAIPYFESSSSIIAVIFYILFGIGIFVLCSFLRNFLLEKLIHKGFIPGWLLFSLFIPLVNIFVWIYIIKQEGRYITYNVDKSKRRISYREILLEYLDIDRNLYIIVISILLSIGYTCYKFVNTSGPEGQSLLIIGLIVNLIIIVLYYKFEKVMFYLYLLLFTAYLLMIIVNFDLVKSLGPGTMMGHLVIFFGVFHFDKFNIIDENNEEIDLRGITHE